MARVVPHSIAVLKLSTKVKEVITFAQSVATSMASNPSFPSPPSPIATFQADVAALATAESVALLRGKGAAQERNAKLAVLKNDLDALRLYVQSVADAANPSDSEAIIVSAGMAVRKVTSHDKPVVAVKQGAVSGSVLLSAKAVAKRAAYSLDYGTDQKTWTPIPQTLQSRTSVSGLTAGTVYYFRVQGLTRSGAEDWSLPTALLVK